MASVTTVTMTDDIDGKLASETVSFGLDGAAYEIDLTDKNAAALRKAFGQIVEHARRIRPATPLAGGRGRRGSRGSAGPARTASDKAELSAIRTWAADNGIEVSPRGRISNDVRERYADAHR